MFSIFPGRTLPVRLLLVGSLSCLAIGLRYASTGGRSIFVDYGFQELNLHTRLHILRYNHGLPVVRLPRQAKPRTLALPATCSAYVRTGDGLAKQGGVNLVRIVRNSSGYHVVTKWASFQNPNWSQLVRRECQRLRLPR